MRGTTPLPASIDRTRAFRMAKGWLARAEYYASFADGFDLTPEQRMKVLREAEAARKNAKVWRNRAQFTKAA